MSLYNLRNVLGLSLVCLAITSCGFRPLHTSLGKDCTASYPIKIATISDRYGQILRNNLVDLLTPGGPPCKPKYILEIKLTELLIDTGTGQDETTKRKQVTLTADLVLKNTKHDIIYKHTVSAINSFAIIEQNYYANTIAETFAKKEGLGLLAQKIKILINAYLEDHGKN